MSANFASALNRLNAVINVDPNVLKNATPATVDEINAACESVAKLAESLEAVVEVDPELGFENQDDWPYEQLTQQNAAVITAAFEQCDADCSGSLNQSETIRCAHAGGPCCTAILRPCDPPREIRLQLYSDTQAFSQGDGAQYPLFIHIIIGIFTGELCPRTRFSRRRDPSTGWQCNSTGAGGASQY